MTDDGRPAGGQRIQDSRRSCGLLCIYAICIDMKTTVWLSGTPYSSKVHVYAAYLYCTTQCAVRSAQCTVHIARRKAGISLKSKNDTVHCTQTWYMYSYTHTQYTYNIYMYESMHDTPVYGRISDLQSIYIEFMTSKLETNDTRHAIAWQWRSYESDICRLSSRKIGNDGLLERERIEDWRPSNDTASRLLHVSIASRLWRRGEG